MTQNNFIIETSYEIVHKVGGCETVVRTKAPEMVRNFGSNFLMVGPIIPGDDRYSTSFEDQRHLFPQFGALLTDFEKMFDLEPNSVRFGQWLIPSTPSCVLLPVEQGFKGRMTLIFEKAAQILREKCNGLCPSGNDCAEQFKHNAFNFGVLQWCFFSFLLGYFLPERNKTQTSFMIIQTHEWLAGVGLVLFKNHGPVFDIIQQFTPYFQPEWVKFVFTTHATTLGRHLSAAGWNLNDSYNEERYISPGDLAWKWDEEAYKRQIEFEHRIERACANLANILTTVSTVTANECRCFLGRNVDVVTWNGLHVNNQRGDLNDHELVTTHRSVKSKILDFCRQYFLNVEDDKTFFFFTAGRYEYTNKGIDLFIDALNYCNGKLCDEGYRKQFPELEGKQVVSFIIAPAPNHGFSQHALAGSNLMKELNFALERMSGTIKDNLLVKLCDKETYDFGKMSLGSLMPKNDQVVLKRFQQSIQKHTSLNPITTHNIVKEDTEILGKLRFIGLVNHHHQPVKVIWIPEFLNKVSIFGLDYQEFIRGAHFGVFASMYEPFGYTSPECMCVGTASVVSNMCGFGNMIEEMENSMRQGAQKKDIVEQSREQINISSKSTASSVSDFTDINLPNGGAAVFQSMRQKYRVDESNIWNKSVFGVQVVDRIFSSYHDSVYRLGEGMLDYLKLTKHERIQLRNRMSQNSVVVDWSVQIKEYIKAYDLAATK